MGKIVPSLQERLSGEKSAFHEAILTLLHDIDLHPSFSQIRQALVEQALDKGFDLNAVDKEGRTALNLAIEQDDTKLASYLLRKGANPEQAQPPYSDMMRAVLTSFRWEPQLYENLNQQDQQNLGDLDRALLAGRYDDAQALLNHEARGRSTRTVWLDAVKHKRLDILRSLLILRTSDMLKELTRPQKASKLQHAFAVIIGKEEPSKPHYPSILEQALALDDAGLSSVLKEFPYLSLKQGLPRNLNGKAPFDNQISYFDTLHGWIKCRHLSAYQQELQALDPKIKFPYSQFQNAKEIKKNVKSTIQEKYFALKAQASEAHLIDNAKFGQFLADQFSAMEKEQKSTKLMLLESTVHTMNIGLRIKNKNGKTSYVVKFFDPNTTTNGTRSKTNSLQSLEMQTIASYIETAERLNSYFPETKGMSMIFVRPEDKKNSQESITEPSSSTTGRMLTTCIENEHIDATAIWLLMADNFDGNLRKLHTHLEKLPEEQRVKLLEGKNAAGMPALFSAMQDGKAGSVKAYGQLLKLIPENRRIELVSANNAGLPALFAALIHGHAEAIRAYGELLDLIPNSRRIEFISGKNATGAGKAIITMFSQLAKAIESGHSEAVKAYGELLASIPEEQRIKLITPGISALYKVMWKGDTEAIKAYNEVLRLIPEEERIKSITENTRLLHSAMRGGHMGAVKVYLELLNSVSPDKQFELLLAKDRQGKSALDVARDKKQLDAAAQYLTTLKQLVPRLSPDNRENALKILFGFKEA